MSDWDAAVPPEKAGGRFVLVMLVGLAVLLGGGYAAAYAVAGDKVPRGASVAGVAIGGQSQAAAVQTLREGLSGRADQPITLTIGRSTHAVTPAQAGLQVDYPASVAAAGGLRSWQPQRLWDYFTGGDDLDAVVDVEDETLDATIHDLAEKTGRAAVNGTVTFEEDRIETTASRTGLALNADTTRAAILGAYLDQDRAVELSLQPVSPEIDEVDVQQAVTKFANPAMSGAITLAFGSAKIRLQPREFGAALSLEPRGGRLMPVVKVKALTRLIDDRISGNGAPVDATVEIVAGKPEVIPAKPGVSYEPADVARALRKLITRKEGKREMSVQATVARADFTTKDARKLKITEQVSTFTTYYPYAEYRNVNIGRAAELVNGTILKPGETFSLNDIVGERTRENGFTEGFIISDGIFKEDLGGGVSQMATTTFNAMYFAGLKDVEHKPHSLYIDRYPVGREATVAWGAVDLRFDNDSPYGVLVEASVTPATSSSSGVVTVSMWSTKVWDITSTTGERYNFVKPKTRTLSTDDCYPNEGYDGFDINVVRHFRKAGESVLDHDEKFFTRYLPSDTVICKKPKD